jgi:EpsI family protein
MRAFVRRSVFVLLVAGVVGSYAALSWRLAHSMSPDDAARIPERLARIPMQVETARFVGKRDVLDEEIVRTSKADHYVAVDYKSEDGGVVRLHVGVNVQDDGWLHEPTWCLPVQGWRAADTTLVPMWSGLAGVDPDQKIWRMRLEKGGARMLVHYWFQWGDEIVTSRRERARHRLRGYFAGERDRPIQIVILYTPIERSEERSAARAEALTRALWPTLYGVLGRGE